MSEENLSALYEEAIRHVVAAKEAKGRIEIAIDQIKARIATLDEKPKGEKTEESLSWRRRAKSGLRERAVTIRRINLEIKSLRYTAETIKRKMDVIEKHSNSRDKVRSLCYLVQQQVESDNRKKKAAIKAENIRRSNEESLRFEKRFIAASKRLNLFDSIIEEMTEDEN